MQFFRDLTLTAACLVMLVASLELGLRLAGVKYEFSAYTYDPHRMAKFRPNAEGWTLEGENYVKINRFGMRDRDRTVEPAPGTVRIALLGASQVAAFQVPLHDTFGQVLERELSSFAKGRHIEVLNFGTNGASPLQDLYHLDDEVWAFKPRIVLEFITPLTVPSCSRKLTHLHGAAPFVIYRGGTLVPDEGAMVRPAPNAAAQRWRDRFADLHNRFRLLQLVHEAAESGPAYVRSKITKWLHPAAQGQKPPAESGDNWIFIPPRTAQQESAWRTAVALIDDIHQDVKRNGAEFWLIQTGAAIEVIPDAASRDQFAKELGVKDLTYPESRFEASARENAIPYIDLVSPMRKYAVRHQVMFHGFFNMPWNVSHWNKDGHQVAADILASQLEKQSQFLREIAAAAPTKPSERERVHQ